MQDFFFKYSNQSEQSQTLEMSKISPSLPLTKISIHNLILKFETKI